MPILNYTTQISFEKTIMEIQKILVEHGATKIITDYEDQLPKTITFCLNLDENIVGFVLPANYLGVLRAMKKNQKVARRLCTEEQALRVSWRIIKVWIEAQVALVQADLAEMAEVFLPYAITKTGKTLYKEIEKTGMLLLNE